MFTELWRPQRLREAGLVTFPLCGDSLGRPSTRQLAPRDLVGLGPAVRPGGSGVSDDASEERTGLCSLKELMLFLRARPSLSVARIVPRPDHLGPFCAG